jgi:hypothetical protein
VSQETKNCIDDVSYIKIVVNVLIADAIVFVLDTVHGNAKDALNPTGDMVLEHAELLPY